MGRDYEYLNILKNELLERQERSPQYSERAFARDLSLSPSFINLLFHKKRKLSPITALKITENITWSETKIKQFMKSVQESQLDQGSYQNKKTGPIISEYQLDVDEFRLISNVHHFAILEFIESRDSVDLGEISKYFKMKKTECTLIIERLCRLGMVSESKKLFQANSKNRKLKDIRSKAIRNYHRQVLALASDSIENQELVERELRALTLSIDPKKLKQAKTSINKFFSDFNKKFGNKKNGEIYQLNLQLFKF